MAHFKLIYLLKIVIFHSYVSLPEGRGWWSIFLLILIVPIIYGEIYENKIRWQYDKIAGYDWYNND